MRETVSCFIIRVDERSLSRQGEQSVFCTREESLLRITQTHIHLHDFSLLFRRICSRRRPGRISLFLLCWYHLSTEDSARSNSWRLSACCLSIFLFLSHLVITYDTIFRAVYTTRDIVVVRAQREKRRSELSLRKWPGPGYQDYPKTCGYGARHSERNDIVIHDVVRDAESGLVDLLHSWFHSVYFS